MEYPYWECELGCALANKRIFDIFSNIQLTGQYPVQPCTKNSTFPTGISFPPILKSEPPSTEKQRTIHYQWLQRYHLQKNHDQHHPKFYWINHHSISTKKEKKIVSGYSITIMHETWKKSISLDHHWKKYIFGSDYSTTVVLWLPVEKNFFLATVLDLCGTCKKIRLLLYKVIYKAFSWEKACPKCSLLQ